MNVYECNYCTLITSAAKITRHLAYTVNYPLRFNQSRTRTKFEYIMIKKYKKFSVLIYSYINTKLCGNTTPEGWSVFTKFRVFPISTSVDITVYLYGKNVLYFFYNVGQRNTKLLQSMSKGKFSVFTLRYANIAINQSAFRILECYVIIICKIPK